MKKTVRTFSLSGGSLDWINNSQPTRNYNEADIVVLEGGADWQCELYGQKPNSYCNWFSYERDNMEMILLKKAMADGKITVGICRGMQGQTIANGGTLVQHISHPGRHDIHLYDGEKFHTNSLHHQLCNPFNLPPDNYKLLGWSLGLSNVYLGEGDRPVEFPEMAYDENGVLKEPEIIYFPETKCLGVQFHPEMMGSSWDIRGRVNDLIEELLLTNTIAA